jgi:hypothetical protein
LTNAQRTFHDFSDSEIKDIETASLIARDEIGVLPRFCSATGLVLTLQRRRGAVVVSS